MLIDAYTKLNWGLDSRQRIISDNLAELDRLASYHGENGKIPIILGSRDGRFGFNKKTRKEFYEDTVIDWMKPNQALSGICFGSQGQGKTWLMQLISSQLIGIEHNFGELSQPFIFGDASAECTKRKFIHPQSNRKMLGRLKPYWRFFPWLKPFSIAEKAHFIAPISEAERLAAKGVYDESYISLKAKDLKTIGNINEAKNLMMELLNIKPDDPAERMIREGMTAIENLEEPTFIDVYRELIAAINRERILRKTQSVSQMARINLRNYLVRGEVEVGANIDWKRHLKNRDLIVLHLPIGSMGSKIHSVLFTVILKQLLNAINEDCPPFSIYIEEAHKLIEDQNSVLARTFRDVYQLHRKSRRRVISVLRMPSYAKELIEESDFILTPHLSQKESKHLLDYTPKQDIDYDVADLRVVFRDAQEWRILRHGDPESPSFYPLPTSTDAGVELG